MRVPRRALLVITLWCLGADAQAGRPPLTPQIQAHGGVSGVKGPGNLGLSLGVESRMTRYINVDLGGFYTFNANPDEYIEGGDPASHFRLRHGAYVAPGLRFPHRQPPNVSWDVTLRGGPGIVWAADLSPGHSTLEDHLELDAGVMGALEGQLLYRDQVGLRASARAWFFVPFYVDTLTDVPVLTPQVTTELVWKF
jgi:hypothetical protein